MFYAHTQVADTGEIIPQSSWEILFSEDCGTLHGKPCSKCKALNPKHGHLNKVAYLAGKFAGYMFSDSSEEAKLAKQWGQVAGWWHDLGKFAPQWQEYLRKASDPHTDEIAGKVDHSTAGAKHAVSKNQLGHLIATAIAGHHAGLLDAHNTGPCLLKRLAVKVFSTPDAPHAITDLKIPTPPSFLLEKPNDFSCAFFQRMLFSCLVDADFLATEAFMNPKQWAMRPKNDAYCFEQALLLLEAKIHSFGVPKTPVDQARALVMKNCLERASDPTGLFSLTVPTGGGKTFSSLGFALKHALAHEQRRIIYVIPFTSIIEQNAAVFKDLFAELGADMVLEHHSNLSPEKESNSSRLAAENWDAPIVVTTAVQFYESLFASKTSRSRKLHNIANSVIILDEAQAIPVQYLNPCLRALEQLSTHYHTSIVFCTATQPAVSHTDDFDIGLKDVTEIISDTAALFSALDRVNIQYRGKLEDALLAAELGEAEQVLCIVNIRKHAQALFQQLPVEADANYHLSALMCPAHRMQVLKTVRMRLDSGLPVRLISTQLIEAGVDIDFPKVYRSMAGLDSISQAAGRCNRNGKLSSGSVHIFHSEHIASERYFQETASVGHEILDLHNEAPLSTDAIQAYFDKYYYQNKSQWDAKDILGEFACTPTNPELPLLFQYRTVAEKFKLIENNQIPIIIPFDESAKNWVAQLRNENIPLSQPLLRSLQKYTVQIYESEFRENQPQFESLRDGQFHILICPETHYSQQFGLTLDLKTALSTVHIV